MSGLLDHDYQVASRASRAEQILADPLVAEVLQAMRSAIVDAFFATPAEAVEMRERLHLMDRARQQFEGAFRALVLGAQIQAMERSAEQAAADALAEIQQRVKER